MSELNYEGLTGEIITRYEREYEESRQEWNRSIQKFPLVIVYCYTKWDVSNAIIWARKNKIDIRIRSGGHHYEGYSVGNNVLVIDISRMNHLQLNQRKNTLKIQGGAQNKQVYDFISSKGYSFPGGTCPTVGISGYTLGGGWGYSSRYFGLGCDSLLELELIDYKGNIIIANETCHKDLFWACRGAGGGNFGVVVSLTFKLPPKVEKVTLVELYWPNTSVGIQKEFLHTWQKWLTNLNNKMTIGASIYNSATEGLAIYGRGLFYGTPEEAKIILQNLLHISEVKMNLQYVSFLEAVNIVQSSYPPSEQFKSTGRFVHKQYNEEEIEKIISLIGERATGSIFAAISLYPLGGKVNDIKKNETAFYYRDAHYIIGIQSIWEDPIFKKDNVQWLEKRFNYIESITEGSFINFPYSNLEDYMNAYYGAHANKLRKINKKYDPLGVFSFPQGIER
ncbi:FAD-binding oxidoreductase [Bacillus clarus]|uniref:Berberine and berberine like family protein n=1 Tax=Bacillus clarus TaxID=2338372 RepID=A0A090YSC8_9BACI|nr:FAD-binding oxidoreductase [Bacillus clarus]KFN01754.1 berberine and berberine like family protein [Bacillus clarus]RFT68551.1 FAD-binding oxidoreductase [Bacillus clarus]